VLKQREVRGGTTAATADDVFYPMEGCCLDRGFLNLFEVVENSGTFSTNCVILVTLAFPDYLLSLRSWSHHPWAPDP
jgi:hypothetical protein